MLWRILSAIVSAVRALLSPMSVGAAAIVEQGGRIVLVRHTYRPGWSFPGGGVKRNEPPATAVIRELQEEIGLTQSAPPQLLGVFVRKRLWVTNLILLYRVRDAVFVFRPNWEIAGLMLADPADLPPGVSRATHRRLAELYDEGSVASMW